MKIVQITPRYNPPYFQGGIETFTANLDDYLIEKGHDTQVIAIKDYREYIDKNQNILKLPVMKMHVLRGIHFALKLSKYINSRDTVIIHYPTVGLSRKLKNVNSVLLLHTLATDERNYATGENKLKNVLHKIYRNVLIKKLEAITFKRVRKIITLNNDLKSKLIERGVDSDKIYLIQNGVNLEKFEFSEPRALKDTDPVRFIYVGRLTARKNLMNMLKAFSKIPDGKYKLSIVGIGSLENEIKSFITTNKLKNVHFIGYLSGKGLIEAYSTCDVYILPSFYEGLPFTLLEAMATGKPAIVGNFSDASKIIKENENGWIVKQNNVDQFVDVISNVIKNKFKLIDFSKLARKHVETNFNLKASLADIFRLVKTE